MKKRLLAGLLSFTMLTAEVLPVIAADDAVVSENVVVEEDAAEEVTEEADSEEGVEAVMESMFSVKDFENMQFSEPAPDGYEEEENADMATAGSWIYSSSPIKKTVEGGIFEYNGRNYNANATVTYNSHISFRGKAIKPYIAPKKNGTQNPNQLYAAVTSGGLLDMAAALSTTGSYSILDKNGVKKDAIEFKFTAKKNKNANSGSYFTVKATVKTSVTKKLGIKGKDLSALKKAVKQFNKAAKIDLVYFTIDPVDFDVMFKGNGVGGFVTYKKTIPPQIINVSVRAAIRADQLEKSVYKYTKLTSKDVTVKKENVVKQGMKTITIFSITPNGYNYSSKGTWLIAYSTSLGSKQPEYEGYDFIQR